MNTNEFNIFSRNVEVPQFLENDSKLIVEWGRDNLIPQWLNYLYYTCAVHQGIINGKVMFTVGGGLVGNEQLIKMFEKCIKNISLDLEISNSFYLKAMYDPTGTKIAKITHIPYEWVRVKKDGNYVVSEDWTDTRVKQRDYVSIDNREEEMVVIIAFKEMGKQFKIDPQLRKVSLNYYPNIPYAASIKSIMTDIEITNVRRYSVLFTCKVQCPSVHITTCLT